MHSDKAARVSMRSATRSRPALARHLDQRGPAGVQVAIVDLDEVGVLDQFYLRTGANEVVEGDPEALAVQVREPRTQRVIRERRLDHFHHDSGRVAVQFLVRHKVRASEVDRHGVVGGDVRTVEKRRRDHVFRCAVLLPLVPQVDAQPKPPRCPEQQLVRGQFAGRGEDALPADENACLCSVGVLAREGQVPKARSRATGVPPRDLTYSERTKPPRKRTRATGASFRR